MPKNGEIQGKNSEKQIFFAKKPRFQKDPNVNLFFR